MRKSETLLYGGKISDSFDSGGASGPAVESHPSTKKATNNHLLVALIRFNQHKGYLVASMKYSQMNTIDMVSSSQ